MDPKTVPPIFPAGHPAICYVQHDPNFEIVPHVHIGDTLYIVDVPDGNGNAEAIEALDVVKRLRATIAKIADYSGDNIDAVIAMAQGGCA